MNKTIQYFFIFLVAVLFYSCSTEGPLITYRGSVKDSLTGKPVPGININLYETDRGKAPSQTIVSSTTSNNTGYFQFQFHVEGKYLGDISYDAYISSNDYYFGNDYNISSRNYAFSFMPLFPKAYLKVHFVNSSPFNANDKIVLKYSNGYDSLQITGSAIDTVANLTPCTYTYNGPDCGFYGNSNDSISYKVTKNNVTTTSFFKIYLPEFQTTTYQLNY